VWKAPAEGNTPASECRQLSCCKSRLDRGLDGSQRLEHACCLPIRGVNTSSLLQHRLGADQLAQPGQVEAPRVLGVGANLVVRSAHLLEGVGAGVGTQSGKSVHML
jgi:hypothetical protein